MDIVELRKKPHLSASGINAYLECSLLYRLSRLDKFKPEFRSDNLEFGSTIHKTLAEFYQMKKDGDYLSLKEFLTNFEFYWRETAEDKEDILYSEGKGFETLLAEGKDLLSTYYAVFPDDNYKILAIEQPFHFTLEDIDIPIIGIFDLVEEDASGTIIITDWKTSNRAYSTNEIDKNLQMTLYQLAVKSNGYHDREILLKLDCLIKTKTPKFEQYYTIRSDEDEKRLIKKIVGVHEGITKNVFIPNDTSWKCPNCVYKTQCDNWFNQETGDNYDQT